MDQCAHNSRPHLESTLQHHRATEQTISSLHAVLEHYEKIPVKDNVLHQLLKPHMEAFAYPNTTVEFLRKHKDATQNTAGLDEILKYIQSTPNTNPSLEQAITNHINVIQNAGGLQKLIDRQEEALNLAQTGPYDFTSDPEVRAGKPCIRNLRISVYDILDYLTSEMTEQEILTDFPELTKEDLHTCQAFAINFSNKVNSTTHQ